MGVKEDEVELEMKVRREGSTKERMRKEKEDERY